MSAGPFTLDDVRATAKAIAPYIVRTPVHHWRGREIAERAPKTNVILKLELFQQSGTFKVRGALSNMLSLNPQQRAAGVTAVSAGNHAIAVAYAARELGISAKVVMMAVANPARVKAAKAYGAEVLSAPDGASAFALAEKIAAEEGRAFIHPFEGRGVSLGTGTFGLEFVEQADALDAVVFAIGGGGLASGAATVIKQLKPRCKIYGVEPEGADSMARSFAAGAPQRMEKVNTIADSLAPPMALPYSFQLCRDHIDKLVTVSDDDLCAAMALMFREMKLAVEPAGAAALAGLLGPLRDTLAGKTVGIVVCGANIDIDTFAAYIRRGEGRCGPNLS